MSEKIGIVAYGVYIPRNRITVDEIASVWGEDANEIKMQLQVFEKSVPFPDEDVATMAVEAARNAIKQWRGESEKIGAIYVGSESHPYAVKPTATIVAAAIGAEGQTTAADLEFACKAGTAGMQMCFGLMQSNMIKVGLAIGSDSSQAKPKDPLEYTAGAGSAAFLIGKQNVIAELEGMYSYTSDTPDFWRREGATFPSHGQRFTGMPAYFDHIIKATKGLLEKINRKPEDYDYVTFHQPNTKFPLRVAKMLGFSKEQVEKSLACKYIGNTYSASSMIGFAKILDDAQPGDRVLVTSYGSGAGSDSFSFRITENIEKIRDRSKTVQYYIENKRNISYGLYSRYKGILKV
ncbi:MAG: hydroxymethylglutaryl-CoA synthase [Candidatus Heimdallarchaeum endolithica]|uniref:Hydroxymethylglutaryl-CoA synthase n=1 Tax=Candidatus Heimdallarchaeum endolithica TaxID=2876572 RepID=A0A9Y1FPD9_9ARCH|nr:MAG: hydroxymethylglutaryl-CoA synthase [Candidatus Heimdallarchaeum endolithica]